MIYPPASFLFCAPLEQHWTRVRDEYLAIAEEAVDWHEREICTGGWKVYMLYRLPDGEPDTGHVARCPFTSKLIENHIAGHLAAGFSVLRPGTWIKPHEGYSGTALRCHLPLIVPRGDCAIRVAETTRNWTEGRCFIFNDRVEHEVWNRSQGDRVALIVDFAPSNGADCG